MHAVFALLLIYAQQVWIPADPKTACVDAQNKDLCAQVLAIRDRDQIARYKWIADRNNEALIAEVASADKQNLTEIDSIIAKHGWPGKSLVGSKAQGAAWTVIQHADLATQKKYIDLMKRAADSGDLDRGLLALTIDRIRVGEGKPQVYGTQFHDVNGEQVPYAIEDAANVDARRAKVGLNPLAEYTTQLRQMYAKPKAPAAIARVWRGRVLTSRADEYAKYLYDEGVRKIRGMVGNLGAQMFRRADGDITEFVVISYWPSRESIKAFAGEDIERVHFLPRDREFLINPDEFVRHYDVSAEEWAAGKK
jgi:heme-degrading monooxygenase HmoA